MQKILKIGNSKFATRILKKGYTKVKKLVYKEYIQCNYENNFATPFLKLYTY